MKKENDTLNEIWEKGKIVEGQDPDEFRKDICGAWMGKRFFGKHNSQYGWEADNNEGPMQWQNWEARKEGKQFCVVISSRIRNVLIEDNI